MITFKSIVLGIVLVATIYSLIIKHLDEKIKKNKERIINKFIYGAVKELTAYEIKILKEHFKENKTEFYKKNKCAHDALTRFFPCFEITIKNEDDSIIIHLKDEDSNKKRIITFFDQKMLETNVPLKISDEFVALENISKDKKILARDVKNTGNLTNEIFEFCRQFSLDDKLILKFRSNKNNEIYESQITSCDFDEYLDFLVRLLNHYTQTEGSPLHSEFNGQLLLNDQAAEAYKVKWKESFLEGYEEVTPEIIREIHNEYHDDEYFETSQELQFSIKREVINFEQVDYDLIFVKVFGYFYEFDEEKLAECKHKIDCRTYVRDITDSKLVYLKSNLEGWSDSEGYTHGSRENMEVYSEYGYSKWSNLMHFHVQSIVPPYKGKRKLEFIIYFVKAGSKFTNCQTDEENIIYQGKALYELNYEEPGFLEVGKYDEIIDKRIAEAAFIMANADKKIDKEELNLIVDHFERKYSWGFINKYFTNDFSEDTEETILKKARFSQFLRNTQLLAEDNRLSLSNVTKDLIDKATQNQKYEMINLLLNIAGTDKRLNSKEDEMLNKIVMKLNFNPEEYRRMKNKLLVDIEETPSEDLGPATFNINENMTKEEKCKILRKEYSKWNAQTNNTNPKIRSKAKKLVELAASLRKEYNC